LITPSKQLLQLAVNIAIVSFSLVQLQPFQQFAQTFTITARWFWLSRLGGGYRAGFHGLIR
jgi:hypothetical protein